MVFLNKTITTMYVHAVAFLFEVYVYHIRHARVLVFNFRYFARSPRAHKEDII